MTKNILCQFKTDIGADASRSRQDFLDHLIVCRNFITRARKLQMKDEEFLPQMEELNKRDVGLKRKRTAVEQAIDAFTELDLEEQVRKYVVDLQAEMEELIHANPQTSEERHQIFLLKKRIVDGVLAEVKIDENRDIHLRFRTNFLDPVG